MEGGGYGAIGGREEEGGLGRIWDPCDSLHWEREEEGQELKEEASGRKCDAARRILTRTEGRDGEGRHFTVMLTGQNCMEGGRTMCFKDV